MVRVTWNAYAMPDSARRPLSCLLLLLPRQAKQLDGMDMEGGGTYKTMNGNMPSIPLQEERLQAVLETNSGHLFLPSLPSAFLRVLWLHFTPSQFAGLNTFLRFALSPPLLSLSLVWTHLAVLFMLGLGTPLTFCLNYSCYVYAPHCYLHKTQRGSPPTHLYLLLLPP